MTIRVSATSKKRRPSRRSQPQKTTRRAAEAMAAAAALAGGTQAYAAPVRFDNPSGTGHYDWAGAVSSLHVLDIKMPAAAQMDSGTPDAGFSQYNGLYGGYFPYSLAFGSSSGELEVSAGAYFYYVDDVAAGTSIPSGLTLHAAGMIYYNFFDTIYTYLPQGTSTYIGVQFTDASGVHNGWIEVKRTGRSLDALAWGYETTPGASIAAGAATSSGSLLGDMNNDGVVNALDVPAFVDALLGLPLPPGSVDRSDMNASGATDGADIQPFINVAIH